MPDYVSRYKDSSIHIFSYILVLYTYIYLFIFLSLNQSIHLFIYIYIKTYISIYLYINLCSHSYGSESTWSTGFMSMLEEQSEKRSMLSFCLMCISQDPWRALRSKLISRLWYKSLIGFGISGKRVISKSCVNQHRFSLLKKLRQTSFKAPFLRPLLKIHGVTEYFPHWHSPHLNFLFFFSVNSNWSATRISSGDLEDADAAAAGEVCEAERVDTVKDCTHASSSFQNSVKSNGAGTAAERGARSSVKECTHASSSSRNSFRSKGGKTEVEDKATPTAAESVGRANALLEAKAPAGSEFLRMLVQKHHQKGKRNGGIKFNIILSSFSNLTTGPDQLFHHVILFSPKIAHLHNAMWRGVVGSRTTYDILLILNGIRRNFKARRPPGVHIRRI